MTIEPMMFFSNLAWGISQISTEQMVVYKVCRGLVFDNYQELDFYFSYSEEKFNLTVDFCANIENNTDDPAYGPVEKEVHIN